MARTIIGVMGPGATATASVKATAFGLGQGIAQRGWVLLTGGRAAGVMEAASQGAHTAQGLVIGVLPDATPHTMSSAIDIPILTGMGQGRNTINVLSSQVIIACGLGAGTLAEMALALKFGKPLIVMHMPPTLLPTLTAIAPCTAASTVEEALQHTAHCLSHPPTMP